MNDDERSRVIAWLECEVHAALASAKKVPWTDRGMMIVRDAVVAAATGTPPCVPSSPCGCYGCPICNGSQAPMYSATNTPPFGSPAVRGCNRYNPCGQYDCQKCFPGQILPPDMRGTKKPNGGRSQATRAANAERGYRVLSYAAHLNRVDGTREGDTFSTPDLATQRARRGAKEGKETFLVLRDGARWKLLKADGDEVVIG